MKLASIFIFLALLLLLPLSVKAQSDCSARGDVILTLDKAYFKAGETIVGKIKVVNHNQIDSPISYSLKLVKGDYSPWTLNKFSTAPPGNTTYELHQIFRFAVPQGSETGKWVVQLNAGMDNCIWTNAEQFYLISCTDGILNGDEEGVDCGGTCPTKCQATTQKPATTTSIQPSTSNFLTQYFPYQLPKNFFLYLALIVLLLMVIVGSSIIYWRRRARFSKFY